MRSSLFTRLVVACSCLACPWLSAGAAPPAAPTPVPTPEQIDASFADGDYAQTLRQIGLALSAKGDMAALYDRHDLLVLKGETHLRLKNAAAAAEAFDQAARWTRDETRASVDRATAELFRRARGTTYTPPVKKGAPAPGPIDVVKPAARQEAFAAMFEQARPRVAAAAKAARQSNRLPAMYDALVMIRDLRALEMAATGEHPASAAIAADVGTRARALMERAVADMDRTVTRLGDSATRIVQDVAFVAGQAVPVGSGAAGLSPEQSGQLRQIAQDCRRVGTLAKDLRVLYEGTPEEVDALRKLRDDAAGVETRARELANVDWKQYYYQEGYLADGAAGAADGAWDPNEPRPRPRGGTNSVQRPARRGNPTAGPRGVNTGGPR